MQSLFLASICLCVCLTLGFMPSWRKSSGTGSSMALPSIGMDMTALLRKREKSSPIGRIRNQGSMFSKHAATVRIPICYFNKNNVPQFEWPTKEKLCFDTKPAYPAADIYRAVYDDFDAQDYLILVNECYLNELRNNTGSYPKYRYRDLCEDDMVLLEKIWWTNTASGRREICHVIMPEAQGVGVANCGRKGWSVDTFPVQKNCMMDSTVVQNHYCVPDGLVERDIYVFCPGEQKQCRRTTVTIPTGCSCKKYQCLKYNYA